MRFTSLTLRKTMQRLAEPSFLVNGTGLVVAGLAWLYDTVIQHFLDLVFFHIIFDDGKMPGREVHRVIVTSAKYESITRSVRPISTEPLLNTTL